MLGNWDLIIGKEKNLFAVKGKCHLSCAASSVREHRGNRTRGRVFFFFKGRKENEGMQGLSGRGSLLLLGHESDSSSLVTAALWLFTSLYRVITFHCTWRPNSITELNLWHNWSQRWVTKQAAQFQKTFLWGFTGTSLSCAQGTVVRFDFSLPWKGGCAKFLMFQ